MLRLTLNTAIYCAGAVLPYLVICLWLWHAGVFEKFWFWTVTYARQYVGEMPLSWAVESFRQNAGEHLPDELDHLDAGLGRVARSAVRGKAKPGLRSFVFGFLACSFLCVCPGFYFRSHYFIVMLPAVAMLAGVGGCDLCRLANRWKLAAASPADEDPNRRKRHRSKPEKAAENPITRLGPLAVPAALLVLRGRWPGRLIGSGKGSRGGAFFFDWPPQLACRLIYNGNPFVECPLVAKYLKEHMEADETVAVLGSEPEIFFDAQRKSATGYIYTYGLMEVQPLAE